MPDKHPMYNILSRAAGTEERPTDVQSRLIDAGKMALTTALITLAARAGAKKFMPRSGQRWASNFLGGYPTRVKNPLPLFPVKGAIQDIVGGGAMGYFDSDIRNALIRAKKDPSKKSEAVDKLKKIVVTQHPGQIEHGINKKAFWGRVASSAGKGISTAGRAGAAGLFLGVGKPGTALAGRIAGVKKFGPMSHLFGLGVKGAAGYGLYRGGKAIYDTARKNRPYDRSYTRMLRNNMLAGQIQPGELSPEDAASVRRLGMR